MNDGIAHELCSLVYVLVDTVAAVAAGYCHGALLAKMEIESAYRLIPVHPQDLPLQDVPWGGAIYIDPMLPFGWRSTPKYSTRGSHQVFHYLDGTRTGAPSLSPQTDAWLSMEGAPLIITRPREITWVRVTGSCDAM